MNNIVLTFTPTEKILLRDFLLSKNISKKTLTRIKFDNDGSIKVNGKEENVRFMLNTSDTVQVTLPSESFSENVRFICGKIKILYEDDFILIVEKEKNLPTIPSRDTSYNSLLEYINFYFREKNYNTIPHIVTRLDKNTTGIVLVAKHRHLHSLLSKTKIDKYYLALAHGKTKEKKEIIANIKRANESIIERYVAPDGDYAKTILETLFYDEKKDISLVKLQLITGRTHQIRVHMKHIGNSLLGDTLYGGIDNFINRQALHAYKIKFIHPITSEEIFIKSPLPCDMKKLIPDDINY